MPKYEYKLEFNSEEKIYPKFLDILQKQLNLIWFYMLLPPTQIGGKRITAKQRDSLQYVENIMPTITVIDEQYQMKIN